MTPVLIALIVLVVALAFVAGGLLVAVLRMRDNIDQLWEQVFEGDDEEDDGGDPEGGEPVPEVPVKVVAIAGRRVA